MLAKGNFFLAAFSAEKVETELGKKFPHRR